MRDALSWGARALCRNDPDFLDLPLEDQSPTCVRCPVRAECLEFAIESAGSNDQTTLRAAGHSAIDIFRMAQRRRLAARQESKAALPALPAPRRVRSAKFERTCPVCAQGFTTNSPCATYCSRACTQRAYVLRRVSREAVPA